MAMVAPHPVIFSGSGITIYSHGLFFALGGYLAYAVLVRAARRSGLPAGNLAERSLAVFAAGLLAARLGFFLTYPSAYVSAVQVLSIWQGGLVSYWGLAGGLGTAAALFGRTAEERWRWLDCLAVAVASGWALGRVGNWLAGDSAGVASPYWRLFYGRVPIQLFESVLMLALALAGWRRLEVRRPGAVFFATAAGYLAGRFAIDFWRDEGTWRGLHVSQWSGLLAFGLLVGAYAWYGRRA